MPGQLAILQFGCRTLGGQTLRPPRTNITPSSSVRVCAQCSGVEGSQERVKGLAVPKQQLTSRRNVLGVLAFLVLQGRNQKDTVAGAAEYAETGSAVSVSEGPFSSEGGFSNFFRLEAPPPPPPPVEEPILVEDAILDVPQPLPATSLSVEALHSEARQDQGPEELLAPASSVVSAGGVVASQSLSSSSGPQWSELGDAAASMDSADMMKLLPVVGTFGAGALVLGLAAAGRSQKETVQEAAVADVPGPVSAAAQPVLGMRANTEQAEPAANEGFFSPEQGDWNEHPFEGSRNSPAALPRDPPPPPPVALEERSSERFLGGVPNDLGMIMRFESEEDEIERMRQQLEVQIAENMDQLAAVTASAEAARAKELALEEDLMRRRADILSVQGHMEGLEQLLTDTTTSLLLKEEEAAQLASQLASASEELRERDAGMAALRAQLAGVQAALADEQGSKEDLAVQLASSLDAFEAMAAEAEALEEQLRESSFAVEALEQQLAGAWRDAGGAAAAELAGTLEREAAAQARVGRQLEASRAELVGHAGTAAALQAQLTASLRGTEGSLEALAAALEGPLAGARPLLQGLRQALQAGAPGEDRSAVVEAAVRQLAQAVEDAALVPTLQTQADSLLEEVRAGSAARQRITRELSHMRQALIEKTGDTEAMKAQLAVSARAAAQLEEQLAAGLRSAASVPGLKDKVQQLGQALSVARERKAATAAELAHTRAALVAKTGQVEELKATNAMLESKLASASSLAGAAPRLQERLSALLAELEGEQQLRARLVAELEWARGSVAASSASAEQQRGQQAEASRTVEGLRAELAAVLEEAAAEPALRRRIEQLAESLASGAATSAATGEAGARGADAELALLVDGLGVEPALRARLAALLQGLSAAAEEHARLGQALAALRAELAARAGDAEALKAQHGASSRALEHLAGRLGSLGGGARAIPGFKDAAGQLLTAVKADGVAGAGPAAERLRAAAARVPGLEAQVVEVLAALEREGEARARVGRELAWARQDLVERAGSAEELKQQLAARGQLVEQLRAELAAALAGAQLVPALQAKVAALAEAKARVARELAFTRGSLAARTGEAASLRGAVARMEEELAAHALAPRLEARVAALLQALAREGEQRRRVGRELAWAKQQLVARAGETQELKMQVAARAAAIERLEAQVADALSQARRLPGLEQQVARLGKALEAERAAKLRAGRELAYTRQALAAEQGDARTLRASVVTKEEEVRSLLAEAGSAPRVRRQLEGALVALEEERAAKGRVADELAHARKALAAAPVSHGGGTGALEGLRSELAAAQRTVATKEAEIGALREQLTGVGKDLAEKRRARDDVTGELEGLRTALSRRTAEVTQLEAELAERHEEVERLTRQVEECQRALAVEQERSAQLQAEAAAAESALVAEQSAHAAAQEALEEQSRVLDAERNATSAARAVWQAKSRALETQLSSEKDEVLRLRRAVERAVATTYELQAEVKRLQEQLSAAKAADVGALEAELAAERATNARLQEELSRVQAALVRAKESVRTEMSHVAQMEAKLKLSRGESSALRNQVLDLGRSLRAAEAKLERLGTLGSSVGSWVTMPPGDS